MPEQLIAFSPRRCVDHDLFVSGSTSTRDACVLFVDLVGFTPLTDRLAVFGSRGTEELSQLLQGFFGQITDDVVSLGGDPIAFGGDALTIAFDGPPVQTIPAATEAGRRIQALSNTTAGTMTLAGSVDISVRIGIARGELTTLMGHSTHRSVPIHLGAGLDLAVATAESEAPRGQVVLHPAVARWNATDANGGLRKPVPGCLPPDPSQLERLVHPVLRDRFETDGSLLESHRPVSVAFANFRPVSHTDADSFARTVGKLLEIVDNAGGELVQVSGGDKGVVALSVFGAPIGHDDDPLRCVGAMLELRSLEPSVKVGITTGPIFTTLLGSPLRRFVVHFGRNLNIAARLMQQAEERQVLVDAASWEATANHLRHRGPAKILDVKGVATSVEARAIVGWRRRRRPVPAIETPLVGRLPEFALVENLLDSIEASRSESLTIDGGPGIGKSRMAHEAVARARTRRMRALSFDVDDYAHSHLSTLWRAVVSAVWEIGATKDSRTWATALAQALPSHRGQLHVLGPLLGLRMSAPTHSAVDPDYRADLIRELMGKLLVGEGQRRTLVVVENTHNLSESSSDLLHHMASTTRGSRTGLLVTGRVTSGKRGLPGNQTTLADLSPEETGLISESLWRSSGGGTPPTWLGEHVFARAGGNPLLVRLATRLVRDSWEPGDPIPSAPPLISRWPHCSPNGSTCCQLAIAPS